MKRFRWCFKAPIIPILLAAFATGCVNKHDEPASSAPPAEAERTVLVYMVANNDLGARGWDDADIAEMQKAAAGGGLGDGRLILMHQAPGGKSVLKEVNAAGGIDTLRIYDPSDSPLSIGRMRSMFGDMRELAPARHYGLVLWSHGTGWLDDGMAEPSGQKRAFGLDGNRQMKITSLARALDDQDFDYVYFDCCHMASVEVAYELRHATSRIVASVTELPLGGMPYDTNVPLLIQGRLQEVAEATFRSYDEMSGSGRTCTISVIETDRLDRLAEATRNLYASAVPLPENTLPQAFERTATCRHFDFAHYAGLIASDATALAEWQDALEAAVSYEAATPRIFNTLTIHHHCGLSTYVARTPADLETRGYSGLQWATKVATALPWLQ